MIDNDDTKAQEALAEYDQQRDHGWWLTGLTHDLAEALRDTLKERSND